MNMNLRFAAYRYQLCQLGFGTLYSVLALSSFADVSAATLKDLHAFCSKPSCTDGANPSAALTTDPAGYIYGSTLDGGSTNSGVIFELRKDPQSGKWIEKPIQKFCSDPCKDGNWPTGRLILGTSGNLYGTAWGGGGGCCNGGMAFKLIPNADRTKWTYRVIYRFCSSKNQNCTDGSSPIFGLTYAGAAAGVPYDDSSPLYGETENGGANHAGVAYELDPVAGRAKWSEKVLYDFCSQSGCSDGEHPSGGLVMDGAGHLFGTTEERWPDSFGVAFELTQSGSRRWTETVLHSFCQVANCTDGDAPNGLLMDVNGNLFGTTEYGGANGWGAIFRLIPNGNGSQYSVIYNFCSQPNCADGGEPLSELILDENENLYGTTHYGGGNNIDRDQEGGGTAFRLSTNGTIKILHAFCAKISCADGEYPQASLLLGSKGLLFGTTEAGGKHGVDFSGGTVFEIALGRAQPLR